MCRLYVGAAPVVACAGWAASAARSAARAMRRRVEGPPDQRLGGVVAASMVEPPTPVRRDPGPDDVRPGACSIGDGDTGGGEVADPALELEVAAGAACPSGRG